MATKTFPTRPGRDAPKVSANGHDPTARPSVAPPKGKVRLPELAIGLFIAVSFALGAVLLHLNSVDKSPALAVAVAVERGQTISSSDLRVVYVSSDDPLARLDESQMSQVVGRVALVDLPAGSLVTRSLVSDAVALEDGEGVAGLSLDPGQYPGLGLAPGDRVNVVRSIEGEAPEDNDAIVARNATIYAVEELESDRKLVSIVTGEADAGEVAAAAGGGSLRLVQVSP